MPVTEETQIDMVLQLAARLGNNPLLVQAGTGNISIKTGGLLWVKASGKWMASAGRDSILVPLDLDETRDRLHRGIDPAGQRGTVNGHALSASVETAMHAVLPQNVVLHVHSVNTIAWAIRRDAEARLQELLTGLRWGWLPYLASGLPLARAIQKVLDKVPDADVLVLGNHGLVVCGDCCESASSLLDEVENRLARMPRQAPEADRDVLRRVAAGTGWQLPADEAVHTLATDPVVTEFLRGGVLYPCQAIFLGPDFPSYTLTEWQRPGGTLPEPSDAAPFIVLEGAGVLVDGRITPAAEATLSGLAQVMSRIEAMATLRYLSHDEVGQLLTADCYSYRKLVENSGQRTAW